MGTGDSQSNGRDSESKSKLKNFLKIVDMLNNTFRDILLETASIEAERERKDRSSWSSLNKLLSGYSKLNVPAETLFRCVKQFVIDFVTCEYERKGINQTLIACCLKAISTISRSQLSSSGFLRERE